MALDGFTRFADYFFDNFFVDWMVQSKIGEARRRVEEARRQVDRLLEWLDGEERRVQEALEEIRRWREQLPTGHTEDW